MIKKRNVIAVYLLSIITFGIYAIYWQVKTKEEMKSLGADIPTAWLLIVPIANIYWLYKYADGYATNVKRDNNGILWFIVFWLVSIVMPAIVQSDLNKIADSATSNPQAPQMPQTPQAPQMPQTPQMPQ